MKTLLSKIKSHQTAVHLLLIALVVIISYHNILTNNFVWDDFSFIYDWPSITNWSNNIIAFFQGDIAPRHEGLYRPLRSLYYGWAYAAFGTNPQLYHLLGLLIHLVASFLSYLLARSLKLSRIISLVVALVFATHPIHVEAIAWVTPTFDVIGVLLAVASMIAFINSRQNKTKAQSNYWFGLSLILATLAYFSNEITLVLPGIALSYVWLVEKKPLPKNIKQFKPWVSPWLILIPAVIYLTIRFLWLDIGAREAYLFNSPFRTSLVMSIAFLKYIWLLIFPVELNVNHHLVDQITAFFHHDFKYAPPPQAPTLFQIEVILSLFGIGTLIYFWNKIRGKLPLIAFTSIWHTLAILPMMQLVPQSILFGERYLYLASFGSLITLVLLSQLIIKKFEAKLQLKPDQKSTLAWGLVFLIVLGLGYRTYLRNFDWQDDGTLWQATIDSGSVSPYSLSNLAKYHFENGNWDKSRQLLEQSYQINPNHLIAVSNLGLLLSLQDETDEAIKLHQHIYQLAPNYTPNIEKYAAAHLRAGNLTEAIKLYREYANKEPNNPRALLKLAQAYHYSWVIDQATKHYQQVIDTYPDFALGYYYMATMYKDLGEPDLMQEYLEKALAIDPNLTPLTDELD